MQMPTQANTKTGLEWATRLDRSMRAKVLMRSGEVCFACLTGCFALVSRV